MGAALTFEILSFAIMAFTLVVPIVHNIVERNKEKSERRSEAGWIITVTNGMGGGEEVPGIAMYGGVEGNMAGDPGPPLDLDGIDWTDLPASGSWTFERGVQRVWVTNADAAMPVCIAGIAIDDGATVTTLSGNLGRLCDADTYESRVEVLSDPVDPPACVWVDRHGSNGIRTAVLAFDLSAFSAGSPDDDVKQDFHFTSPKDICKAPFVEHATVAPPPQTARRDGQGADFTTQLVKSNLPASDAVVRLCENKHTKGPNFVSLSERLYCDMRTRQISPVCEEGVTGTCFDVDEDQLVHHQADVAQKRGLLSRFFGRDDTPSNEESGDKEVKVLQSFQEVSIWE